MQHPTHNTDIWEAENITPLYVTKYAINIIDFCKTQQLNIRNNVLRWVKIFEVLILHRNSGVR